MFRKVLEPIMDKYPYPVQRGRLVSTLASILFFARRDLSTTYTPMRPSTVILGEVM
jgi:hypothetical protein